MRETKKREPLHRISGEDASTTEQVFKVASFLMMPESLTQAKAFEALVPHIQIMRNKKYTWQQITKLLNECGFKLEASTVRSYYVKFISTHPDICEQRMRETTLLMAEIRQKTEGAHVSVIARMVSEIIDKKEI